MPDEFAFLPRDRVDGRHISGVGERHESRHAFSRKRHLVESIAAQDCDLCELHLRPRVAKTLHHLRHGAELRFVPPLPGGVVRERGREIVEPVGIERLGRDDRLVALIAFGRRLRRRQSKPRLAELLRGELAVIGDRLARRTLVEPLGPLGIAHLLRRSPLPIGGAGDGERSVGRVRRASEAVGGDRSVMKEAERDPAGMEGGVDPILGRVGRRGLVADLEREARLVEIEELARDHPPLAPPSIGTDQRGAILRREAQKQRRLIDAVGAPGVLDPREHEAWIVAERQREPP